MLAVQASEVPQGCYNPSPYSCDKQMKFPRYLLVPKRVHPTWFHGWHRLDKENCNLHYRANPKACSQFLVRGLEA